jgi:hypothetical protein
LEGLPVAVLPLWQVMQVPRATPAWLNPAGTHATVLWQLSQDEVVAIWFAGFPGATNPVWHVKQVPGATAAWLKRAPCQVAAER